MHEQILAWVRSLASEEKDGFLAALIAGNDSSLGAELYQRCTREWALSDRHAGKEQQRHTVGELRKASKRHAEQRQRIAAEKAKEERERREREEALAREKYLEKISEREAELWEHVEQLIATKQPAGYDQAVTLLGDLREVAARNGRAVDFRGKLGALCAIHFRKPSFIARLKKAGLK